MEELASLFTDSIDFIWSIFTRSIYGFSLYGIAIGFFVMSLVIRFLVLPFMSGKSFNHHSDTAKRGVKDE